MQWFYIKDNVYYYNYIICTNFWCANYNTGFGVDLDIQSSQIQASLILPLVLTVSALFSIALLIAVVVAIFLGCKLFKAHKKITR